MMMGAARPKKPKKKLSQADLDEAVQMVRTRRMTLRAAAKHYGISKSTLFDHVAGNVKTTHRGPEPFLGRDVEERICGWLTKMARIGYGQTHESLLNKVQELVNKLQLKTPWPNGRPSRRWYELFMNRNVHLKLRQAQLLSRERAGVTREGLAEWYNELNQYLTETGNLDVIQHPLRIYNCDETGFPISPKPPKIIAEKGAPNVYARGSSSKQTITALLCASAAGTYLRPMIVYPGTNFRREFITKFFDNIPDGEFGHSHSGWMDQTLFLQWLSNVFEPTMTTLRIRRPVLLFIDGARVHLSLEISEFCDENNIILYVLYPNATHLMQPLDLSLMGSVKQHYREAVRTWIEEHPFETYDKFAFPEAFRNMWKRAGTIENAAKGFKVAGLYPFDPHAIDERKLYPAELFMPKRHLEPPPVADAVVTEVTPVKPKANCYCTSANPGCTSANPGCTSANPGCTSANPGCTSANPGCTSANPGCTSAKHIQ